jgi:CxxC motif-containing protein (DUF1111 family)
MRAFGLIALAAICISSAALADAPPLFNPSEARPGGAATVDIPADDVSAAFARAAANLPDTERARFNDGARLFYTRWIAGPAPAPALTGVGPLYNALSCEQCHRNDGRGRPPGVRHEGDESGDGLGAVARLIPPDPIYGAQVQGRAIGGLNPEGSFVGLMVDATRTGLPRQWLFSGFADGPLTSRIAGVVAPSVSGMGLLEAIPAARLDALADPDDADGDGISGKRGTGRFGWRARFEKVRAQTAQAFALDMGLSTTYHPAAGGDCTAGETACLARSGHGVEVSDDILESMADYVINLGPPARDTIDTPELLAGRALFYETGCAQCHTPSHKTGPHRFPWLADQMIWPYSDLLLHDMGPGLGDAGGQEWRTPPLWGLGRHGEVNGNAYYLHDGRAKSLDDAIRWHGGEGAAAKAAFDALPSKQHDAILDFLRSL